MSKYVALPGSYTDSCPAPEEPIPIPVEFEELKDGVDYIIEEDVPEVKYQIMAPPGDTLDPESPPWLCDHIKECDPECNNPVVDPTTHSCDTCCMWMNEWQGGHGGFTKRQTTAAADRGITGYGSQFTLICGLWTTPAFFKECGFFDHQERGYTTESVEYAISWASQILHRLSGRQYPGQCERLIYPGCNRNAIISPAYRDSTYQRDTGYKNWSEDFLSSGTAASNSFLASNGIGACCDVGSCGQGCDPSTISLPGTISEVIEVVIDGVVLPRSSYGISGHKELIRLDGGVWPAFNDLRKSPFEAVANVISETSGYCNGEFLQDGSTHTCKDEISCTLSKCGGSSSWAIRYLEGKCAPIDAQLAAAALAREILPFLCPDGCNFDAPISRVQDKAGVDALYFPLGKGNKFTAFPTGIYVVDMWLNSVNPNGLMRPGSVHRASFINKRQRTVR